MQRLEAFTGIIEDAAERAALEAAVDATIRQMNATGAAVRPYYGMGEIVTGLNNARFDLRDAGIAITASALIWRSGRFQGRGDTAAKRPEQGNFAVMMF